MRRLDNGTMAEQKLTILQLLPALESGGVERGTLEIARGLVQAGHRSLVVSGGGQLVSRLTGHGSEHIQLPVGHKSLWSLRLVYRLRRLMASEQIDIVHVRSRMPAWLAWLAWRGLPEEQRPAFVTTVHGLYSVSRYSHIMTRGERVIAVSESARRYITENYPQTDATQIRMIERGIDPDVYPSGFRPGESWISRWYQDFPFLLERQVLTLPGRITRLKGHLDFLYMLARLVEAGLPVYGLIVGGEDPRHAAYAEELQRNVQKLGLNGLVTFTGHRMDLRDILSMSNLVFSLSSKPESFGRTVCEALSLGVPVVAYDHGGVGEMLARVYPHGRVPAGDVEALTATTRQLLEQARPVEPASFTSVQDMVDQTLAVYHELVSS
ncbi:Glycosyltransferase [hydrothermal vent metagenome]|uniref:Glycosyltransferase n=1 Tax=hydrothermal vent metagenome TaxID=652676 RepID=A0A3B0Y2G5_9ZZZZ